MSFYRHEEVSVFKVGLKGILKEESLEPIINAWVRKAIRICYEFTLFLNWYLLRLFESELPIPSIHRNFIRQCMALCVVNSRPDTESDLYRAYQDFASPHPVREPIDASGMSQVITYLAKEYEVNYHNHLELQKLRLLKIQWTHYCQRHGLDKPAKRFQDLVDLSQAKNYDSSKHDETTVEWVAALMMPVSLVVIHALNIVSRMLRLKTSTLVPLYSTDAKYLTLDTDVLGGNKKMFRLANQNRWCRLQCRVENGDSETNPARET